MKIITKGGLCPTKKKMLGFQFIKDNDDVISLGGSFSVSGDSVIASDENIDGNILISSSYATKGCKLCGNKSAYICPNCKTVVCYNGDKKAKETCPACKSLLEIKQSTPNALPKVSESNPFRYQSRGVKGR